MPDWHWKRVYDWCTAVFGVINWEYISGNVAKQADSWSCVDRVILALEHLCIAKRWGDNWVTDINITPVELATLREKLLMSLSNESGWRTLVTPPREIHVDFSLLPPSPPPPPQTAPSNPTTIDDSPKRLSADPRRPN
ncbi:hypothetical protein HaLaN_31915 [Haematococcus lacustris]|uniref:Uncharacterized protein n=1 Tax=Haematococcus lacustris TaxID=44745 RepID=A0A6A0AK49_HAELA|nr:hypothetical protein HaLaN_31915 [Haematococcus lacustris]